MTLVEAPGEQLALLQTRCSEEDEEEAGPSSDASSAKLRYLTWHDMAWRGVE